MSFYRVSGAPNIQEMNGAASTVLVANGMVNLVSGALAKASSTSTVISGLSMLTRATTDSDYASAKPVLVDMLGPGVLLFCDNVVGTLTQAMEGTYFKLSSTTGISADAAATSATPGTAYVLLCIKFISATQGYFMVNANKVTASGL